MVTAEHVLATAVNFEVGPRVQVVLFEQDAVCVRRTLILFVDVELGALQLGLALVRRVKINRHFAEAGETPVVLLVGVFVELSQ